jgi:ABC-type branched-subunit amino acid transport system substrate-binding protein
VATARAAPNGFWNHGGATARLARPAITLVINVPAPASTYLAEVLAALEPSGMVGRRALLLHSTTGFGREVAWGATQAADRLGLKVTEFGFQPGDAARAAELTSQHDGDILLVAGGFDDERVIAERVLGRPWWAAAFVAAGVEEILHPLGDRLEGVYGPCQWLAETGPDPEVGPDHRWLSASYQHQTGAPPPYPAVAAFAAGVLWERCVGEAGTTEPEAVMSVAARLNTTTVFGRFRLHPDTGLQDGHRVGVVRWRSGRRELVTPPT